MFNRGTVLTSAQEERPRWGRFHCSGVPTLLRESRVGMLFLLHLDSVCADIETLPPAVLPSVMHMQRIASCAYRRSALHA